MPRSAGVMRAPQDSQSAARSSSNRVEQTISAAGDPLSGHLDHPPLQGALRLTNRTRGVQQFCGSFSGQVGACSGFEAGTDARQVTVSVQVDRNAGRHRRRLESRGEH